MLVIRPESPLRAAARSWLKPSVVSLARVCVAIKPVGTVAIGTCCGMPNGSCRWSLTPAHLSGPGPPAEEVAATVLVGETGSSDGDGCYCRHLTSRETRRKAPNQRDGTAGGERQGCVISLVPPALHCIALHCGDSSQTVREGPRETRRQEEEERRWQYRWVRQGRNHLFSAAVGECGGPGILPPPPIMPPRVQSGPPPPPPPPPPAKRDGRRAGKTQGLRHLFGAAAADCVHAPAEGAVGSQSLDTCLPSDTWLPRVYTRCTDWLESAATHRSVAAPKEMAPPLQWHRCPTPRCGPVSHGYLRTCHGRVSAGLAPLPAAALPAAALRPQPRGFTEAIRGGFMTRGAALKTTVRGDSGP